LIAVCLELATRSSSSLFLVLLLTSALFVTVSSFLPTPTYAQDVTLEVWSPLHGPPGTFVSFSAHMGAGHPVKSGACTLTASSTKFFSPSYSYVCNVVGDGTVLGSITGSFRVRTSSEISTANPLPGVTSVYSVTLSAAYAVGTGTESVTSTFTVDPVIAFGLSSTGPFTAAVAMETQPVYVHGWGFDPASTACTLPYFAAGPGGDVSCQINNGELTGEFIPPVGSALFYPFITVTGNSPSAETATQAITIVSGPAIIATPSGVAPDIAPLGIKVTLSGTGFVLSDSNTCAVSIPAGPAGALYTSTPACTMTTVGSWRQPSATFTIASTASTVGTYTLRITGSTGDYADTTLAPSPSPDINPGLIHYHAGDTVTVFPVLVNAFSPLDAGPCTFTFNPTGVNKVSTCVITSLGLLDASTSFVISDSVPGRVYTVKVTGSMGDYSTTMSFQLDPDVTFSSYSGTPGQTITMTGTGFDSLDSSCAISSLPVGPVEIVSSPSCTVTGSTGRLTGSFIVSPTAVWVGAGYTITIRGTPRLDPAAGLTKVFMIAPKIDLVPPSGSASTVVTFTGSGFAGPGGIPAPCNALTSIPGGLFAVSSCTYNPVDGTVSGQFTVSGPQGGYIVFVSGSGAGDMASKSFAVGVAPTMILTPNTGSPAVTSIVPGTSVQVSGTGFNTLDAGACQSMVSTAAGLFTTFTCSINSSGVLSGQFTVSPTAQGKAGGLQYTVTVTGSKGDFGSASFWVLPIMVAVPNNGGPGATITILGAGFNAADNAPCNPAWFSSTPTGLFAGPPAPTCSVSGTTFQLIATFTVPPLPLQPGLITVTFAAFGGPVLGSFTKTSPVISFLPGTASGGDRVTVTGSGFSTGDTTCTINPVPANVIEPGTDTCSVSNGIVSGAFTVKTANNFRGAKNIVATGSLGDGTTNTPLTVVPKVTYTPNTNVRVGTLVTISGNNFDSTDASLACTDVSAVPGGAVPAFVCNVAADGTVTGSFTLATTASAPSYVITVIGGAVTPLTRASASAPLTVMPHVVTLSPASGPRGASISYTANGFSLADTCPASNIGGVGAGNPVGAAAVGCTTASGGTLTGTFPVDAAATPGSWVLKVAGSAGDSGTANFIVNATLSVTPTAGRPGTNVLVSGGNFVAGDTGCTISSNPSGLIQSPLCNVVAGAVSGSFATASGTSGLYTVKVTGNTGDQGSASFNAPPPPSLTLGPNPANAGSVVTVSGTNYAGTTCLITASPGGLFSAIPSCSISAGTLSGSFTVAAGASGSYTVTTTTNAGSGDSATSDFSVTVGPPPTLTLTPITGSTGTVVTGTGTGFATDITCIVSAAPTSILTTASCTLTGGGGFTVGFTVASSAPPGTYTILAVGNTGKVAPASFTVVSGGARTFTLTPTSGRLGTVVTASGTNFAGITCSLTSSPSGLLSAQSCSISGGTLTGGFTVAAGAPAGGYTVTVTTDVASDTVSASFTVPGATLNLGPSTGAAGTTVTATGINYAGSTCTLTSSPIGLFTSQVCAISAAGALTGGFTVASDAASGTYTVTATNPSESSFATFTVPKPILTISPNTGAVGTAVSISGTNFVGSTCSISSSPSGLINSARCLITGGNLDGGFVVATGAAPGGYTVTVTPDLFGATPASTSFTVPTSGRPKLTLSPVSGATGTAISVSGSGYSGTTCTLSASGLFGSAACAISGGTLTGGFTVATGAAVGSYTVTVTSDVSSDTTSAVFSVTKATTAMCIIATATFGSEAAPAVQFLRNFRDGLVLHTSAGSAFMTVFNAWYYSFSPTVAGFISSHDPIRAPIKVILYPLLGILSVSTLTYSMFSWTPEFGVLIAGLIASSLIGLVYLTPFTLVGMRSLTRRKRINTISITKASLLVLVTALGLLAAGELAGSFLILAIASSAIVLTCIIAAPTIVALLVLRPKSQ
jgi:hypothetical protein